MITDRRVLIVDDHPVVVRGLRTMLDGEPWVGEILEATNVADAIRAAVSGRVHVIAMDVALGDGDGVEATRRILAAVPGVRVLILTMAADSDVVSRALRAGAHGYLLKDTDPDTIIDALRMVAAGGVVLGPGIGDPLLATAQQAPAGLPPPFDSLTQREREIIGHLATGESNVRIARHLGLSEKTVRNQLSAVFAKLGVSDRVQAALLARDVGIT